MITAPIDCPPATAAAALAAFGRAAHRVPAYRDLLATQGVNADAVTDFPSFLRHVPITDKASFFGHHHAADLCVDRDLSGITAAYTSSGHSGTFSFGLETSDDEAATRDQIDRLLSRVNASPRRTLLINALPAGVRVPTTAAIAIDTGTRPEAVLAAIEKLGPSRPQIVIIAEHPFLKETLEAAVERGLNWKQFTVHLVTGGEVMPENFRAYAGSILGHELSRPDRGSVVVSLGVSEVSLSLGQETPDTVRLRLAAHHSTQVRRALFGDAPFAPTLVQYDQERFFLETIERDGLPRLVVTSLDPHRRVPLIRYCTDDWATLHSHQEMADVGRACDILQAPPQSPAPFLALFGRGKCVDAAGVTVYPEQIKEALYEDPTVAAATTANFRILGHNERLQARFQLKPEAALSPKDKARFTESLRRWSGVPGVDLAFVPYYQFLDGMELSYQKKFRYL